jgi:hypothetical protein
MDFANIGLFFLHFRGAAPKSKMHAARSPALGSLRPRSGSLPTRRKLDRDSLVKAHPGHLAEKCAIGGGDSARMELGPPSCALSMAFSEVVRCPPSRNFPAVSVKRSSGYYS